MPVAPVKFQLLRAKDLAQMLDVSVRTIWKMTADGRLPKPLHFSSHLTRWRLSDVLKMYPHLTYQEETK